METTVETAALLLLIAAVVAMLSREIRLPYSAGLVAAGIIFAMLPFAPRPNLTRNLIFTALLPPLLFQAALEIHWPDLRRDFPVVGVLASAGVLLSACVTAGGMHYFAHWPWITAFTFGVLIAATDPVSVVATFREAKAQGRLLVLIEGESLLNDGTAAVAFGIVLAVAAGTHLTLSGVLFMLVKTIGGGVVCGGAIAILSLLLAWRTEDHLVELTFTTVAAYGSFLLAEHFGMSGVLATITAGLIIGNHKSSPAISERGERALPAFWEYAAFLANSLVFLLIGTHEAHEDFRAVWPAAVAAIVFVLLSRAAAIYSCSLLFLHSSLRIRKEQQHVLFWGGLRGALALALALGLPQNMPKRDEILTVSFAVVAFSVFVQGISMTPLLRRMGEIPESAAETAP